MGSNTQTPIIISPLTFNNTNAPILESHCSTESNLSSTYSTIEKSTIDQNKDPEQHATRMRLHEQQTCKGCGLEINERFFFRVFDDQIYHGDCLSCSTCKKPLIESCYFKSDRLYCKEHYRMLFTKCASCQVVLNPTDCVYRCSEFIYHVNCFRCVYCKRELQKGEQYYCIEGKLICQMDYLQFCTGAPPVCYPPPPMLPILPSSSNAAPIIEMPYPPLIPHPQPIDPNLYYEPQTQSNSRDKKQPKRPRTILNAQQRKSFKIAFEKSPKPTRKVREQLARETGLSVRVVQVWMQNQRAKLKKEQRKRDSGSVRSNSITGSNSTDSDLKSIAEDELKSIGDSLDDEFDSEDYAETLSGRSSTIINQPTNVTILPPLNTPDFFTTSIHPNTTPIDKLYQMQQTYFSLA